MAEERVRRRLAAILAADVVGYSRLMAEDETGTLAALKAHRKELIEPKSAEYRGRVVKLTGDGTLMEFGSAVDAVLFAVDVQRAIAGHNAEVPEDRRITYRVGINIGDIIVEDDDIYGDGVNVAARLEGLADPGGVCVSRTVYNHIKGKVELGFEDLGEQKVKNIPEPVQVYRVKPDDTDTQSVALSTAGEALPLPDKPSIAVLPFDNMSDDPGQEHFADGIAEDVITALSCFRSLFVIARNSSFSYKGTSPDIRTVARELGVRYVVEGSVRKAGDRVRITAQLIDAASGNHLWAGRFDGSLDDVFDLQDRITEQIVVAVEPEIQARERERARRKPPESLDAWELFQSGLSHLYRFNKIDRAEAIRLFREAIALDPEFAAAHAHLAYALWSSPTLGYAEDMAKAVAPIRAAAEKAVSLDLNDPVAHIALGRAHIFAGEIEMAIGEMQTAIAINPNFAWGHYGLGVAYHYSAGQSEQALPHFDAALRLSPRDPMRFRIFMMKGSALRVLGRHDEAIEQKSEARAAVEKAMQLQPALSIGFIRSRFVGMNETTLKSLLDSLRKAGVPE
jgi:adenylate cyclase